MTTSKKLTYQQLEKERDMWRDDFYSLYDTVVSMNFWDRLKYLIKKGDI